MTNGSRQEVWSPIRQTLDVDRLDCVSQSYYGGTEVGCLRDLRGRHSVATTFRNTTSIFQRIAISIRALSHNLRRKTVDIEAYSKRVIAVIYEAMARGVFHYR